MITQVLIAKSMSAGSGIPEIKTIVSNVIFSFTMSDMNWLIPLLPFFLRMFVQSSP